MVRAEKKKINPNVWYSLQDLYRDRTFHWVKDISAIRKFIQADIAGKNTLKTLVTGKDQGRKYRIKGENIINFIKEVEAGKVTL